MTRFEKFNEALFESYCMKSVSNAVKKERKRKAIKGKLELPLSVLTDAVLYALPTENDGTSQPEKAVYSSCTTSSWPRGCVVESCWG